MSMTILATLFAHRCACCGRSAPNAVYTAGEFNCVPCSQGEHRHARRVYDEAA